MNPGGRCSLVPKVSSSSRHTKLSYGAKRRRPGNEVGGRWKKQDVQCKAFVNSAGTKRASLQDKFPTVFWRLSVLARWRERPQTVMLLKTQSYKLKSDGYRAFSVCALQLKLWNTLSLELRNPTQLLVLKRPWKLFLSNFFGIRFFIILSFYSFDFLNWFFVVSFSLYSVNILTFVKRLWNRRNINILLLLLLLFLLLLLLCIIESGK